VKVLCLVIVSVNVTKYMPQKCQIWQICGYQVCFSSSKYSKTRFRSARTPLGKLTVSASRSRRLGCQAPQHKFLATPMLAYWRNWLGHSHQKQKLCKLHAHLQLIKRPWTVVT